jgi:hypothetical protein
MLGRRKMEKTFSEDHVLPRPVERLPEYAHAKARQNLANRLVDAFDLSKEAASTISNAVVDPTAVRKSIGEPTAPEVEAISVPGGGTLLGIRTIVWARKVMPDPRNPRILPTRRHPFAVDPGTGGEDSKFRPMPEPRTKAGAKVQIAELVVDVESRDHLTWASQQASEYVLVENDWRPSIASQGVMEAVWLVVTTYDHRDDSASVTTMVSAEGSSRVTGVHYLLGVRSADVPYDENESKVRNRIKKLNEAFDRGLTPVETITIRCEQIPALILVGFRRRPSGDTTFPTAVKSLVALRHVDPPKPWGEGPENESLADEVLDEWYRQRLISAAERDYFAGACTRAEARTAHLSDDPVLRAARIVRMFTSPDERIREAIRTAVTRQSTRKRMSTKLYNELAAALILRAIADDRTKTDQIRRYMRLALVKSIDSEEWQCTDRDTESLAKEALREVRRSIRAESHSDPGPASLELVVRAAYPLIVSGSLRVTLGSRGSDQPDRRSPAEVLDVMRRTPFGVLQLRQALRDFATDGQQIRAVDESGEFKRVSDGSCDQLVNDEYLRGEFPPPGKARSPRPGDTPIDTYRNRINDFIEAVESLNHSFAAIRDVTGDDGRSLVDTRGLDPRSCSTWREVLRKIDEDLVVWGSTFRRVFGTTVEPSAGDLDDDERVGSPKSTESTEYHEICESPTEYDQNEVSLGVG